MKHLSNEHYFYHMSKDNKPKLTVDVGDTVKIDTLDCFTNQIQDEDYAFDALDWDKMNPASGPIFVNGIQAGDVLKVTIQDIEIGDKGVMVTVPDAGVMGKYLHEPTIKVLDIKDDTVLFNDIEIPINKMVGVIGVAPKDEAINNGTPDTHGGNMDSVKVTTGATLYLPVYHDGALFGLGDLHGAMGDGEVSVSGLEVEGSVTVTLEKAENVQTEHPILVNDEGIYQFVSHESLDEAVDQSVQVMIQNVLEPRTTLTLPELTMLMSLVGQTEINQVVDPLKTARFFVPQYVLDKLNIELK